MKADTARRISPLLYLGPVLTMFDRFAISPLLLPIAVDLHAPVGAVATAASLYYLFYGFMQPVYGLLSDRFGRVRVMRGALVGVAVTDLISTLAPNLTVFVMARCGSGSLVAAILPTSLVYIGDTFPFRLRQRAIADLLAAVAIGTALGTLGAGLLGHFASWRVGFGIPAIMAALLAFLYRRLPESLRSPESPRPMRQFTLVLSRPWAVILVALALAEGTVIVGFLTYLAPALEAHGENAATAGLVVAMYGVAVLGGTWTLKRIVHIVPAWSLIGGGGVLLVLGYALAALDQDIPRILAASALAGGAYAFMHSSLQAWATDVVPEARGTATSLFVTGVFVGGALSAAASAGLAQSHRYGQLFGIAAAVAAVVLLAAMFARWRYPESTPSEFDAVS